MLMFFNHRSFDPTPLVMLNTDPDIPAVGENATICGKGLVAPKSKARPSRLQEATDFEVSGCPSLHEDVVWLCTKPGPSQAKVCNYDSGSPLLINGTLQVGIVTGGIEDSKGLCTTGAVAHTPVARYYDWIKAQLPAAP